MEPTVVVRKPLLSEKSTEAAEHNRYAFEVDRRANKTQIKKAVQELYGVRVLDVATVRKKGTRRRTRFGYITTPIIKKAVVKVHPEDRIEFF